MHLTTLDQQRTLSSQFSAMCGLGRLRGRILARTRIHRWYWDTPMQYRYLYWDERNIGELLNDVGRRRGEISIASPSLDVLPQLQYTLGLSGDDTRASVAKSLDRRLRKNMKQWPSEWPAGFLRGYSTPNHIGRLPDMDDGIRRYRVTPGDWDEEIFSRDPDPNATRRELAAHSSRQKSALETELLADGASFTDQISSQRHDDGDLLYGAIRSSISDPLNGRYQDRREWLMEVIAPSRGHWISDMYRFSTGRDRETEPSRLPGRVAVSGRILWIRVRI